MKDLSGKIYEENILTELCKASTIYAISQIDYEGTIKTLGDTVLLRVLSEDDGVELVVDQEVSFSFNGAAEGSKLIGMELARFVDGKVFAKMIQSASASNKGDVAGYQSGSLRLGTKTNPVITDKNNIIDVINDMGGALHENNIPFDMDMDSNWWCVLPNDLLKFIRKADVKNTDIKGSSFCADGRIGDVGNMTVYVNVIPTSFIGGNMVYHIPFGHNEAFGFACGIKNKRLIYGRKAINKDGLGVCHARTL